MFAAVLSALTLVPFGVAPATHVPDGSTRDTLGLRTLRVPVR